MKINSQMQIQSINKAYGKNVGKVNKMEKAEMKTDKIEISEESKSFQVAMKALSALPEIREAKVEDLKKQVDDGTYKPSAKDIATKMLQNARNVDRG